MRWLPFPQQPSRSSMRRKTGLFFGVCTAVWLSSACDSSEPDGQGGGGTSAEAGALNATAGTLSIGGIDAEQGGEGNQGPSAGSGNVLMECSGIGATCVESAECCSGVCDPSSNACASVVGACAAAGDSCAAGTDCCTFRCDA